ncbi:protein-export chaperone SecB [Thioalkalivibrio denitrificans]|uniref:Protein-export protein SecB n=1 Tax=Thioalkalivibrio denitrificans TaxID=108003 RepID=A0A1V3N888_9GAMM|nr:protein-export chaperone SecB [Thioalkalivibrio denitrificans]OOG21042.1 protein-export chaperone SecB [Thioalkalivibrio denitrificans]
MTDSQQPPAPGAASGDAKPQQEFGLHKFYLKDVSLEAPRSPQVFTRDWKPDTNVQLNSQARPLDDQGMYEVELTLTVTTKSNDETAYLVEVKQGGVFLIRGFPEDQLNHLLAAYCPNTLFPFAREVVSDLVVKAGFPQMLLAPVNFDMLYAQQIQQRKQESGATGDTAPDAAH